MPDRYRKRALEARDVAELQAAVTGLTSNLGFDRYGLLSIVKHQGRDPDVVVIDNRPQAYHSDYEDKDSGQIEPVLSHVRVSPLPILWDQSTYVKAGLGHMWEVQAEFGYRSGLAMCLHLPNGRMFGIGLNRSTALPADAREVSAIVSEVQTFALHAHEAALRMTGALPQTNAERMTSRELDVLRWSNEGKTANEVATILGISLSLTNVLIGTAVSKLGCYTKGQALARALNLGILV